MCKELEERKKTKNIDLKFNDFCEKSKNENIVRLLKQFYILSHFQAYINGIEISDMDALDIAKKSFYMMIIQDKLDILYRVK